MYVDDKGEVALAVLPTGPYSTKMAAIVLVCLSRPGSRQTSCALCVLVPAMQFTKTLLALAAVFGAVFQLQGCDAATTAAPGNSSNSTRMLEDAELLA